MLVVALTADPIPASIHTSSLISGVCLLATTIVLIAYLIVRYAYGSDGRHHIVKFRRAKLIAVNLCGSLSRPDSPYLPPGLLVLLHFPIRIPPEDKGGKILSLLAGEVLSLLPRM